MPVPATKSDRQLRMKARNHQSVIILTTEFPQQAAARWNDPSTCLFDAVLGATPDRPAP
jgi:hypothetical protein